MAQLNRKQTRTVDLALNCFYSRKAWLVPRSFDDFRVPNVLARELKLGRSRVLLMTDEGLEHLQTLVSIIDDADVFDGLANYSDVYGACRDVLARALSKGERPNDAQEFVGLVREHLAPEIDRRTFAVAIFGLELEGVDALELGSMKVVPAAVSQLDAAGVRHENSDISKAIEITKTRLWLIGSARGTATVAEEKFRAQAEITVGMLAVSAASMYEHGATAFRIGVVMSPEEAYGRAVWLSWTERERTLTTHMNLVRSQNFKIDADLVRQFNEAGVLARAFALFQAEERTPLAEAITRAVYWYSDAHREAVPVMKLVKYWSCVETFFSAEKKDIARSVSVGLTCVLVFGDFNFVPLADYAATKKRIVKLYDLRSRAVHRAAHRHVSKRDAANLSQWVAWMLINMVALVERGYSQVEQVKKISERLDAQVRSAAETR